MLTVKNYPKMAWNAISGKLKFNIILGRHALRPLA